MHETEITLWYDTTTNRLKITDKHGTDPDHTIGLALLLSTIYSVHREVMDIAAGRHNITTVTFELDDTEETTGAIVELRFRKDWYSFTIKLTEDGLPQHAALGFLFQMNEYHPSPV